MAPLNVMSTCVTGRPFLRTVCTLDIVTTGAVVGGAVVKVHVTGLAIVAPDSDSAPLIVAVYVVLEGNGELGVKVVTCVAVLYETDPAITLPVVFLSVKLIVFDRTASLNVAVGAVDTATLVAPDMGLWLMIVGAVEAAVSYW